MRIRYKLLALMSFLSVVHICSAEILYRDFLSGFNDVSEYTSPSGYIVVKNSTDTPIFDTHEFDVKDKIFHYTIRLKSSSDTEDNRFLAEGEKGDYGVVWNYSDSANYSSLIIREKEYCGSDIMYSGGVSVEVATVCKGEKSVLYSDDIDRGIDENEGYNSICLLYDGNALSIQAGKRRLKTLFTIDSISFLSPFRIGTLTGGKSKTQVRSIRFESKMIPERANVTSYTQEQVDSLLLHSKDDKEGYWLYLDRVMDKDKSLLGGKYKVVVLRNGNGYDVLYQSGAEAYSKLWKPLMLKGRLTDTQFVDNYNAVWYDSRKLEVDDEGYVTFVDNLMTIHLPLHKTEVRFQKLKR